MVTKQRAILWSMAKEFKHVGPENNAIYIPLELFLRFAVLMAGLRLAFGEQMIEHDD